ncbi:vacuolar import and degradation protein-domain-containing protein [Microdochium trichocladiopsis]|uniref:Vacuolar import and degradation protein-domain-containing protein n=1 Tax=Microdochium trichocladiopsis TaxID=1682393 RepID=A0A9P9BT53_9PEZI|nr:vacuolar import and degradation protein-domain-containing protein [Microdochium trichocladiopsis]KAH7039611.1 vacuolar import and degradation protein-domain-containing protein [Microdochium trichocladiopsis]
MPTPSTNSPPELPPRNHISTCPDESWGPGTSNWDGEYTSQVQSSTANVVAPTSRVSANTAIGELSDDMRSATNSPRPESIVPPSSMDHDMVQTHPADSAPSMDTSQHYKPSDEDTEQASSRSNDRGSPSSQATLTSRLRGDTDEDGHETIDKKDKMMSSMSDEEGSLDSPMGYEFSNRRIAPTSPSTFLRPGARFHGTQQSERQVYDVQVELKYVDLRESYLCGYLKIQGLTEDNPTLTTFFEGEIVGSKYGFITKHEGWGATEKVDINHWSKFSAFRPYKSQVRKGASVSMGNLAHRENIFMRWKEHFLVPDHRVRTISGASFEGFYYICFNMREGSVSGIYFHSRSEKFQQLELKYQEDRGSFGSVEFR